MIHGMAPTWTWVCMLPATISAFCTYSLVGYVRGHQSPPLLLVYTWGSRRTHFSKLLNLWPIHRCRWVFCITDPNTDSARRSFVIFTLFLLNLFNFFCYLFLRICFANFCLVLQNFQLLLYIPLSLSLLICSTNSCLAGLALSVVSTQKKNTEFNNVKHALLRLTNDLCGATLFGLFFEVY